MKNRVGKSLWRVLVIMGVGVICGASATAESNTNRMAEVTKAVSAWFTVDRSDTLDIPECVEHLTGLSRDQVERLSPAIWEGYAHSPLADSLLERMPAPDVLQDGRTTLQRHDLKLGSRVMPFCFLGKAPTENGRPLFLALHGGGSAGGRAPTPHGWPVNTREWETQVQLAARVYPAGSLYFVPRMADDNDGRWYFNYCQDAYDTVVRAAILHHRINPNRVYLIGISEGAYTAYRLGSFMADRWAGAGSMAGGEPPGNAPPENMRNMAFRAEVGEHDTMFDRVGLNRRYGEALEQMHTSDPQGYHHVVQIQPGRGHAIDYAACPEWIFTYERNPWPERVVWKVIKVHGRYRQQFYWLGLNQEPSTLPVYIDARIDKQNQSIHLTMEKEDGKGQRVPTRDIDARVYLNDAMLDLDRAVRIVCNGEDVFNGTVTREGAVMLKSLAERGDPSYLFSAEVRVPPASSPPSLRGRAGPRPGGT